MLSNYPKNRDNHNTYVVNRVMSQALHKYLPENGTRTFHFPEHILIKDVRTIAHMTMSISITYDYRPINIMAKSPNLVNSTYHGV